MAAKRGKKKPDLPDWALPIWEEVDCPDISKFEDVFGGPLIDRRFGLRRDDIVEVQLDSRALRDADATIARGRLLGTNKNAIELLDTDGTYHYIARDVVVEVNLICHLRPPYIDDEELLSFEREDAKRRSKVHEQVDKNVSGMDDSHLWG
jgi:hypothetical protein